MVVFVTWFQQQQQQKPKKTQTKNQLCEEIFNTEQIHLHLCSKFG